MVGWLVPLLMLLHELGGVSGSAADAPRRRRPSERIEEAAGYTLADVEDQAAQNLLAVLFEQIDLMEEEVAVLKKENKDIRDRLSLAELKAEAFQSETKQKLEVLAREQDAGLLSEASLTEGLGLLGVQNSSLVGPILRRQGLFSVMHLLALDHVDQLELHHVLQRAEPAPLSLTLRARVPLASSLQSLGLQAPTLTAAALQSLGYESTEDLLAVGEHPAAREQLCDELRKYSGKTSWDSAKNEGRGPQDGPTPRQTTLSLGDRRAVMGLADLGSLLHTSEQRRRGAQAAHMRSSTAAERRAISGEEKLHLAYHDVDWLWKAIFGRASVLDGKSGAVGHTWVASIADAAGKWLPRCVVCSCRLLWLQLLMVATGGALTPWVQAALLLICTVWVSMMMLRHRPEPPHGHHVIRRAEEERQ